MSGRSLTKVIVLAVIASASIYDIVIYAVFGVDATISRVLLGWARDIPIVVLPVGVLLGHLFWPQRVLQPGNDAALDHEGRKETAT